MSIRKVLVLKAGDTKILRRKIKIISIAKEGTINLTTTCPSLDLTNTEDLACWGIDYAVDGQGGANPWDKEDVRFTGIGYLDEYYAQDFSADDPKGIALFVKNTQAGLFTYTFGYDSHDLGSDGSTGDRLAHRIVFKGPTSVVSTMYATFTTPNYGPIRIFATPCTNTTYCCHDSVSDAA